MAETTSQPAGLNREMEEAGIYHEAAPNVAERLHGRLELPRGP